MRTFHHAAKGEKNKGHREVSLTVKVRRRAAEDPDVSARAFLRIDVLGVFRQGGDSTEVGS